MIEADAQLPTYPWQAARVRIAHVQAEAVPVRRGADDQPAGVLLAGRRVGRQAEAAQHDGVTALALAQPPQALEPRRALQDQAQVHLIAPRGIVSGGEIFVEAPV